MIVDVLAIREQGEPLTIEHTFPAGEVAYRNDVSSLNAPVFLKARIEVTSSNEVRIQGKLRTRIKLMCSRCLAEMENGVEDSFDLIYLPARPAGPPGDEIELQEADLDVGFYQDFKVDLKNVLIERILMKVPMKPICREDCRGLCPRCGADLNAGPCDCAPGSLVDPRLAVLADLKKKLGQ